jgi:hypothetical protein
MIYEFYWSPNWVDEDRFIGLLPKRRKAPQGITHQSIMNWAKLYAREGDVVNDKIYFIKKDFLDSFFPLPTP